MVDTQGQDRLGLYVHAVLIEAGIDEHRSLFGRAVLGFGFDHLHANRLALYVPQLQ
ncbi:hypothetical protein D9M71_841790 [compost metagenome]